jgi:hypothetical protein
MPPNLLSDTFMLLNSCIPTQPVTNSCYHCNYSFSPNQPKARQQGRSHPFHPAPTFNEVSGVSANWHRSFRQQIIQIQSSGFRQLAHSSLKRNLKEIAKPSQISAFTFFCKSLFLYIFVSVILLLRYSLNVLICKYV